ncbi:MAG: hypothetical protein ACOX7H_06755 [Bacillota bacterium]|jgi:hypothetical protein
MRKEINCLPSLVIDKSGIINTDSERIYQLEQLSPNLKEAVRKKIADNISRGMSGFYFYDKI